MEVIAEFDRSSSDETVGTEAGTLGGMKGGEVEKMRVNEKGQTREGGRVKAEFYISKTEAWTCS